MGYRFASPIENDFKTYIGRVDYSASSGQNSSADSTSRTTRSSNAQQFPDQPASTTREVSKGFAAGHDWVLGSNKVNTFRYGYTKMVEDTLGLLDADREHFRFIDDHVAL